jgi:Uncharacterized protein conserved in bacteria (DUF2059)
MCKGQSAVPSALPVGGFGPAIPGRANACDHGLFTAPALGKPTGNVYLSHSIGIREGSHMHLPRLLLVAFLAAGLPAMAENPANPPSAELTVASVAKVMQFDALFQVLREEGVSHGATLEDDMIPGGAGPGWHEAIARIYDVPTLRARFDAALDTRLSGDPDTLAAIIDFFASDVGQRVVTLEIDARRAFLDTATEEAARVAADKLASSRDPRYRLIQRMIEAGDLLEMNVAGAMSGNLAFMSGMAGSGAYGNTMPEDQILSDVWSQEEQIRADSSSWLYAYMGLAYAPLTEAELQAYVDFAESPAGERLNAALFHAFDTVFRQVSYDLGRATGIAMQGRDI